MMKTTMEGFLVILFLLFIMPFAMLWFFLDSKNHMI